MQASRPASSYRQDGKWFLIELKLKTLGQVYNSFDPSPFHERDLDDAAARYIVEALRELSGHHYVKLMFHLPKEAGETDRSQLSEAIHNYFSNQERVTRLELREKLRFGRTSLAVGLLFLALCFQISSLLRPNVDTFSRIIWEGLMIIGWVMLWRPLEIFLYGWWPLLGKIRLYQRLKNMPVEFQVLE